MAKGVGHLDAETLLHNSSTSESNRPHQWFADAAEQELFPNKRQAVESPNTKLTSGIPTGSLHWDNVSGLFIDRLFGGETTGSADFSERNFSPVGTESSNMRNEPIDEKIENHSSLGLSMSYGIEEPNACLNCGRIRKVKVNQLNEPDSVEASTEQGNTCSGQGYNNNMDETCSISMGLAYGKEQNNTISFEGFQEESDIDTLSRPTNNYNLLYSQPLVQPSETPGEQELVASNPVNTPKVAKPRPPAVAENKSGKPPRKEAPNSFPSNVRSLIATGMLDGVSVKYAALSRKCNKELRGVIKGSGYLCGCQLCNFSKALNAYEFEQHAGCKTKHPNSHIYFENGKTIYQIVQELKSTPETLLFDAIQTVTGSPINQKALRIWKESFQAATRELQRIYGKEQLNL